MKGRILKTWRAIYLFLLVFVLAGTALADTQPLSISFISYPEKSKPSLNGKLIDLLQKKLENSELFSVLDLDNGSVAHELEDFYSSRIAAQTQIDDSSSPIDLICVISTDSFQTQRAPNGSDLNELKARVILVDVAQGNARIIRTVKSSLSGSVDEAADALTLDLSNQILKILTQYHAKAMASKPSTTQLIYVRTGQRKFQSGQKVVIYQLLPDSAFVVSKGIVITKMQSRAIVLTEKQLKATAKYAVKSRPHENQHGIILDSDW